MIRFWAKTASGDGDYLPVEAHLRDAGAVGMRLFDVALTDRQRAWIADAFGVDVPRARALVGFLVAVHDIGKVGPFQHQVPHLADRLGSACLRSFVGDPPRHDRVSGYVLHRHVTEHGGSFELADALSAAVCGHHSVPAAIRRRERYGQLAALEPWREHQDALLERISAAHGVGSFADVTDPGPAVTLALAGLVNVSDWNASDAGRFPVTSGERPASALLAERAIHADAWSPRPVADRATFRQTFGCAPRAMQSAVVALLENAEPPWLLLIEDRTGSGKTEAALWAARGALEAGARGLYVGLPTRATANQLHRRAKRFLDALWPGGCHGLRLLHGGADVREADGPRPSELSDERELVLARTWFDGTRRGLLSPYAVGTVDQALLAVLAARFYPVRLWGLAGKAVIVDEAHAYDDYTGALLEGLLRWLAALECATVVLSATLPADRRERLVRAYRSGLGAEEAEAGVVAAGYPRVTLAGRTGVRTIAVDDDRPGRVVTLEHRSCADDTDAVVRATCEEVEDGGCVAVVCSTVAQAQERYAALRKRLPDVEALLLHSRIRPLERRPVEVELAELLGPDADGGERPERLVVVATQIIEQSLDLDFDVMLTDLAPVDLLVQRAGRVHRHERKRRPSRHSRARLIVLDADGGDEVDRPLPKGAGAVYVDAVLTRTRAVLRDREAIHEPADLDAVIGAVYGDVPAGVTIDEEAAIRAQDARAREMATRHRRWAEENGIGRPDLADPPWRTRRGSIADGDIPGSGPRNAAVTRWSERPSVDIVVLRPDEAYLADRSLDGDTVRALLLRSVRTSAPSVVGPVLAEGDAHRPRGWRRHGVLAHHALAVAGAANPFGLDWHPELGVML